MTLTSDEIIQIIMMTVDWHFPVASFLAKPNSRVLFGTPSGYKDTGKVVMSYRSNDYDISLK